jgi:hypothetical protein
VNASDGNPAAAIVEGRRFSLRPGAEDSGFRVADPAGFLTALAAAKNASLVDAGGKALGALSTAGVSAALLYMDEKQGRLDTVTALIRKGPRPASAVPPPPPLPVVVSTPPSAKPARRPTAAQVKLARGESACEKDEQEQAPEVARLDARSTLVLVPLVCGSGAYNFLSIPIILDEQGKASRPKFSDGDDGVYNAEWDPKTRRLGTYMKGRGIGDCGVIQTYAWDGARFRLVEQSQMGECRGSLDYITTWRAAVR